MKTLVTGIHLLPILALLLMALSDTLQTIYYLIKEEEVFTHEK